MHTHNIDIILRVEQVSGVLGPAAAMVMQYGLKYQKHSIAVDATQGLNQLTLETEGGLIEKEELSVQLSTIPGVHEVIDILLIPKEDAFQFEQRLDKEGRRLAEVLSMQWPNKLIELSQKYEDSFHRSEQETKVTLLGEAVGRRLAMRQPQLHDYKEITETLRKIVIPLLENVANCEVKGNNLEITVSLFSRRFSNTMDLVFGSEAPKCYFLTGFIQGVLNQAPKVPEVTVTEPECRAVGDKICLFKVEVAQRA